MQQKKPQLIQKLDQHFSNVEKGKATAKDAQLIRKELENDETGGAAHGRQFVIYGGASGQFIEGGCAPVDVPSITPKFKLEWGDGPGDVIETHDNEVLHISACNLYNNITFKGLKITNIFFWTPPTILPNGEPAIQIHTPKGVCYGDLNPCSCIERDFMLTVQNEQAGVKYIIIQYEIDAVELSNTISKYDYFPINLVNS